MKPVFHLSLGVKSIEATISFYVNLLKATVAHRDPSGYVNLTLFGGELTLKEGDEIGPLPRDFHFGFNFSLEEFESLSLHILEHGKPYIEAMPRIIDAGTPLERKKMYLKCPSGYLIELKGYP